MVGNWLWVVRKARVGVQVHKPFVFRQMVVKVEVRHCEPLSYEQVVPAKPGKGSLQPCRCASIACQGQWEMALGCPRPQGSPDMAAPGEAAQRVTTQCPRGGGKACHVWDQGAALEHGMSSCLTTSPRPAP